MKIAWVFNDGGREAAGFKGHCGDCVVRAIAIAAEKPYRDIYEAVNILGKLERNGKAKSKSNAREGVFTHRKWFPELMISLGFAWTPIMGIGTGCTVHLAQGELPPGRLVVSLSKHFAAVIDGVLNDTSDCSREGTRCVYGYWRKK